MIRRYLSSIPLWPVLAGMVAGIAAGIAGLPSWWIAVPAVASLAFLYCRYARVAIMLMAMAIGWADLIFSTSDSFPERMDGVPAYYVGDVMGVKESETGQRVILSVSECGADSGKMTECSRFKAIVFIGSMLPPVKVGDEVRVNTAFARPEYDPDIPYETDYTRYLAMQGIDATAFVSADDVAVCGRSNAVRCRLMRIRTTLSDMVLRSSLQSETSAFINAILLGDTSLLPESVRNSFVSAGMAHLLALSGMHVAIIAMVMAIALLPLSLLRLNHIRYAITIVLLWLYAVMTGLSPSVVRAVVMATLILTGHIIQRQSSALNNMCAAAVIILLFDPMALVAPGFQLSFVAVASILIISPAINLVDRRKHPFVYRIASWVSVSVSAVLGTGLLAAYYFHTYPLYFLFGNLVAVLVMPVVMGASVLLLAMEAVGIDPVWLCQVIDWLYSAISWSAGAVSSLSGSTMAGLYFPAWILIPYYIALAFMLLLIVRRRMVYAIGLCVSVVSVVALLYVTAPVMPQAEYFITRNAYRTDIVVRNGTAAYLLTTAPVPDRDGIVSGYMRRYDGYFGRAGVKHLRLIPDTCVMNGLSRAGSLLSIGSDSYMILHHGSRYPAVEGRVRYALVCRGYSGSMYGIAAVADTVLLSRDLVKRRHDRYAAELRQDFVPYRSLRDSGIHRVFRQDGISRSYPFLK